MSVNGYNRPEEGPPPPAYEEHVDKGPEKVAPGYEYPKQEQPPISEANPSVNSQYTSYNTVITDQPRNHYGQNDFEPEELLRVNDYMGLSVFSCVCCCLVLGVVALVFSCLTSEAKKNGNYPDAIRYSQIAKILSIVSICLGFVWISASILNFALAQ